MKHIRLKRAAAAGLALLMAAGPAAMASEALGHDIHGGKVGLAPGAAVSRQIFWSDTYSDLRTERYLTYTPSEDIVPTVAYGDSVLKRQTLSAMAKTLEGQGKRVVGGINGDYYAMATGSPVGLVLTDGVVRSAAGPASAWYYGVGFRSDGTAFIGKPALALKASFHDSTYPLGGGINKIRTELGGYTLLTQDFAASTQNTSPGVDVILTPVVDQVGQEVVDAGGSVLVQSSQLTIGGRVTCTVDQVLESEGSIPIPAGKLVLTINGKGDAALIEALKALQPGETVSFDISSPDARWLGAVNGIGAPSRLLNGGTIDYNSFQGDSNASGNRARTAIGLKEDGTVIFYTIDAGASGYSVGCTLAQVAMRLRELGCVEAVALDGGGSTTLGATYPGDSAMEILNRPSEGAQRANSTAIFLTTTLPATNTLGSYYVTPTDAMLLSGASIQLSAEALDTSFYPMAGTEMVSYYIQNGDGTVTADGLFTAGGENSVTLVTASDGIVEGSASMTVVKTPDAITLSNEKTGAPVTSLNLIPGEQVDLKAAAVYRKLPLLSQDSCYAWSCPEALGVIDQEGVFTAGSNATSGIITVSAGGKSVSLPVSIAGHVFTVEDCEADASAFTDTETASAGIETSLAHVHNGVQSLKLTYDSSGGTADLTADLTIREEEQYLGVWVYGDGSGNTLTAAIAAQDGQEIPVVLTGLDFTGWKHVSVTLPEGAAKLTRLSVVYGGGESARGVLWLDQFTTSNEPERDSEAPEVSVKVSGRQVTASASDNMDRSIPGDHVTLTYDGAVVEKSWDTAANTLTATLPEPDGMAHRVTVTVTDNSGNLARASADIAPDPGRQNVFADMAGHWAATYATYLYRRGVTSGTGEILLYSPDRNITRGEFFAMTARWMDLDLSQFADVVLPFADVDAIPPWAMDEIKAMYSLGILSGTDNGDGLKVNAAANISRAEVMAILDRTQARGYAAEPLAYADAGDVPAWALHAMRSLVSQGIVSGYQNRINPMQPITRAEVAVLLYSML
ncbi:hypothetical protein D1159_13600 [Pseudoflavonifractor sp. 524-17]|uniref:phosphodiester glycosidase family protein n=1 Tax=Pseudoflavonifractor sp. 524-17 TaxID=2304577 RepID=UPI00137ADEDE|nr:phosphodiester glycosidase family protein [Pseudoflavonifractor sp. 524-17]NCE65586.1 hypothetical protein [Pseudoflavonifractor sp. 524-17]